MLTLASKNRRENQQPAHMTEGDIDSSVVDVTMEHAPLYRSRLGELKAKSSSMEGEQKSSSSDDFFEKLRAKSFKAYDEKIKENRIVVENIANDEKS